MAKSRREINADQAAKLKLCGVKRLSIWIDPDVARALRRLAEEHGSQAAAVNAVILAAAKTIEDKAA